MSISLFTGFVRGGKSYHATSHACRIADAPRGNRYVIANFPIKPKKKFLSFLYKGDKKYNEPRWIYKDNEELTVEFLVKKSLEMGWDKVEGSCLILFDEASIPFNARSWQDNHKNRMGWIKFLTQSGKLGYDVIFITQEARMIDKQIRALCEFEVVHRKLNSWGFFKLLPFTIFVAISFWNGVKGSKGSPRFSFYRKSVGDRYDTKALFGYANDIIGLDNEEEEEEKVEGIEEGEGLKAKQEGA